MLDCHTYTKLNYFPNYLPNFLTNYFFTCPTWHWQIWMPVILLVEQYCIRFWFAVPCAIWKVLIILKGALCKTSRPKELSFSPDVGCKFALMWSYAVKCKYNMCRVCNWCFGGGVVCWLCFVIHGPLFDTLPIVSCN